MEPSTLGEVEKKVEETSTWKKVQNTIWMIAALMISAGQWSDTKDIITSSYEAVIENFTHSLQYEILDNIHIGNSIDYVKSIVGEPSVIKRSKINPSVLFQYYNEGKFNLTLISSDSRIVGYSVFTQKNDFTPKVPFSENLGSLNINNAHKNQGVYSYDIGNLIYYIESQDLGKEQMFLTLMRGYVEYGATPSDKNIKPDYKKSIVSFIEKLDEKVTFSDNEEEISIVLNDVRNAIYPNYYAITELEPVIIAEALLTRYEYKIFTKS
ncbi:MAG: hypothetical protein HRU38_02865 [Saccharospirillaceae bacterium]|nr:hypothetical protein [Colwellia sp.]NRB77604.1 hypothetical protein [Saccharospirillaceae bacterium]